MVDTEAWNAEYKKMCRKYLNMNDAEAEEHLQTAPEFDRGYSAFWYITEELNCKFAKRRKGCSSKDSKKRNA